jgi:hypothetical protein
MRLGRTQIGDPRRVEGASGWDALTNTHGDWYVFGLWFSPMDGWFIALQNQALAHDYGADVRIVQPVPSRVGDKSLRQKSSYLSNRQDSTNNLLSLQP